jgi:uncharacterized protein YutE (UPF0331/DUF86 family)
MDEILPDEVLLGKAEIIERCLARIDTVYRGAEDKLETDYTIQDSILLNLQRICEASIDAAMHIVRLQKLGIPKNSRQAFTLIVKAGILDSKLGEHLEAMVGFRNIAVHNYTEIDMDIVRSIIKYRLKDLAEFSSTLVKYKSSPIKGSSPPG